MTEIKVVREGEKATAILRAIRQIDEGAELVPVVHGRWVKKTAECVYYFACSECGEPVLKSQWGHDFFSDYCPNCGADMRGAEDG